MAKCNSCGRKGMFLKVNSYGVCDDCQIVSTLKKDKELLSSEISSLKLQKEKALSDTNAAKQTLADLRSEIDKGRKQASQYHYFVTSIKAAIKVMQNDEAWNITHEQVQEWENLDIESFLCEPKLNCLTVKDLSAKYRKIRKDIIAICKTYEARYTTKAISAMYKLMILAMEAEFENVLYKMQFGKLEDAQNAVRELSIKYYDIASDGNQSIASTLKRFIVQIEALYMEALKVEYEYYVQRERAKEEQRAIREQMRQETEERKKLEAERKKVEAEEHKYRQEIERITAHMQQAHDAELEDLRKRLEEMNALIAQVEEKKEEIINLQNGKAGTVYVISNIGSFGDHVYKIGMTRRIDPQDRVNELGDASVPFPFDVHSFIFSEDAVALETALHHELDSRRVNKVNLRKEFFNISIEELQKIVERIDPTAPFKVTALAEQYRQSISISESDI